MRSADRSGVGRFAVLLAVVAHRKPRGLLEEDGQVAFVHVAAPLGDFADGEVAFLQQDPHALQFRAQDDVADEVKKYVVVR